MDSKQTAKDVAAMRLLTEWTGHVTEGQVKTLNVLPVALIPEVKSHELNIDLENHQVIYKMKLKPDKVIKDLGLLVKIEQAVWALLGDTWQTIFRADRRIIYSGSRRKQFVNPTTGISNRQSREGSDPQGTGSVPKVRRKR